MDCAVCLRGVRHCLGIFDTICMANVYTGQSCEATTCFEIACVFVISFSLPLTSFILQTNHASPTRLRHSVCRCSSWDGVISVTSSSTRQTPHHLSSIPHPPLHSFIHSSLHCLAYVHSASRYYSWDGMTSMVSSSTRPTPVGTMVVGRQPVSETALRFVARQSTVGSFLVLF